MNVKNLGSFHGQKKVYIWIFPCLITLLTCTSVSYGQYSFADQLYKEYDVFKEDQIQQRRFTHSDIAPLINELKSDAAFEVTTAGHSIEGRPIYLLKIGKGDKKILFWSQMHGDESTATMALFDLFNFFRAGTDSFAETRKQLLQDATLYFIPMLNPDGAEVFTRRNAIDIDINRDALRLTSPESKILKQVRDSLNPDFGFNLHDQSSYYSAGSSSEPATLSFLAPAYDYDQSENEIRSNAMRLIASLNEMLQQYIPGKVAKYSDAHEPRAFGDMIQKWGTSTILIESGGYPDDPEKQYIRKLNFVSMLSAIEGITQQRYSDFSKEQYYQIPQNRRSLTDLLVREIQLVRDNKKYLVDLNIRRWRRVVNDSTSYYRSTISDVGDLSTSHGYNELQADKMEALPGRIYPDTLQDLREVRQLDFNVLLGKGYTDVVVKEAPQQAFLSNIPFNLVTQTNHTNSVSLGTTPNVILKEEGEVRYVIVNGFIYDVQKQQPSDISNTLVID